MPKDKKALATQFASLVDTLGLSNVRAAHLLGVTDRTISRWLRGDTAVPATVMMILQDLKEKGQG